MGSRSSPSRPTVSPQPPPPDRPGRHQDLAIALGRVQNLKGGLMGRLSHLGSKRNSDVLLVVQDGAPAWKTSPASGVMLSVRYQAHCSASQRYAVSKLSSLEELESRSATHLRTNWRRDSRNGRLWNDRSWRKA